MSTQMRHIDAFEITRDDMPDHYVIRVDDGLYIPVHRVIGVWRLYTLPEDDHFILAFTSAEQAWQACSPEGFRHEQ